MGADKKPNRRINGTASNHFDKKALMQIPLC
jgi:hypothetical protein